MAGSGPLKKGTVPRSGEPCASEVGCNSGNDAIRNGSSAGRVSANLESECRSTRASASLSKKLTGSTFGSGAQGDRTDSVARSDAVSKNATFVVSGERARDDTYSAASKDTGPGATFAVLPPSCDVVCIDGSAAGENAAGKTELLPGPADTPCASSASRRPSAKRPIAGSHQSSRKSSCDQSTATSRFRKRLEFTELHKQPRGFQAGTTSDSLKSDIYVDTRMVSANKALSESSGQFPVSSSSCSELHTSSAGSSSKIRQEHRGFSYMGSDEEMLVDVPEPSLVTNSPTALSMRAVRQDDGATTDQLTSPEGRGKATLVNGHIPTHSFYSSSTAKKRSKPPSTPSSRPSDSGRAKAKKHRSAKAGAKGSDRKCRCTPASSSRKRRAVSETRSTDMRKQKVKGDRAGVRGVEDESRVSDREETAVAKNQNDSLLSLFAGDVKMRSLPPTPPSLLDNIVNVRPPEQEPNSFAGAQSEEGSETQALAKLPDICEPVVFDTADVDLTAGINIDDILDRLDDASAQESIYWSFTELPQELLKKWVLRAIEMEPHKAVFSFVKDSVKLIVSLGDFVRQPGSTNKDVLAQRTAGAVPRRTKLISALSFQINCLPQAYFNQYILKQHFLDTFKTDELLKRYPTTDSLGKMLGELGAFFVRYGPLSKDISCSTAGLLYSFNYPVLSVQIVSPRRLIWFHLDLPIDLDAYPYGEILPSSRPYSDKYDLIKTDKLRRITAYVKPGPMYIRRLVEEIEAFLEK